MECWNCKKVINETRPFCDCVHSEIGYPSPTNFQKYIVKDYLGSGQFGFVFKCFDPFLKRTVAIKKLDPRSMSISESLKEMQTIAKINNNCVVQIYDSIPDESSFVMEFVEGGTLQNALDDDPDYIRRNFIPFALDICEGIRAAHKEQICHRDLKTENILLTKDKKPKVSDFGLARFITSTSPGKTLAGTMLYMAPEVFDDDYGLTIDIYSLGVIFYKIWTGEYPFVASTPNGLMFKIIAGKYKEPKAINPDVPSHINELITKMVCFKEDRINSISLISTALDPDKLRITAGYKKISIDDFQKELTAIYGQKNAQRVPLLLLDHFSTNIAALIEALRSTDLAYRKERSEKYFPKAFAWLCSVYTSLGVYLSEILWCKYPGKCHYCDSDICKCESFLSKPKVDINKELLDKINKDGLPSDNSSESFSFYQEMFRKLYGHKNQEAGLNSVALHMFLEINEARDAMLKIDSNEGFRKKDILHLELADLTAWFFALLDFYDDDYNFDLEFQQFFKGKCFACGEKICNCPDIKFMPLAFWPK